MTITNPPTQSEEESLQAALDRVGCAYTRESVLRIRMIRTLAAKLTRSQFRDLRALIDCSQNPRRAEGDLT